MSNTQNITHRQIYLNTLFAWSKLMPLTNTLDFPLLQLKFIA